MPRTAVPEPTLMILPYFRSAMRGATCFAIKNVPRRFTAITLSHSSTSISVNFCSCRGVERGVIHQHVDLTETFHAVPNQALHGILVADIADFRSDRVGAVLRGDFGGDLRAINDVGDHHAGAFGGEREGVMPADTLRAAGHDGGAAVQSAHSSSPYRLTCSQKSARCVLAARRS